jgi:hypothetical protein
MAITEHPATATAVTASLPEPCTLLHGQDMQTYKKITATIVAGPTVCHCYRGFSHTGTPELYLVEHTGEATGGTRPGPTTSCQQSCCAGISSAPTGEVTR